MVSKSFLWYVMSDSVSDSLARPRLSVANPVLHCFRDALKAHKLFLIHLSRKPLAKNNLDFLSSESNVW